MSFLKGLSHEIFGPVFGLYGCKYLGLNVNHLWFLNFNDAPVLDFGRPSISGSI